MLMEDRDVILVAHNGYKVILSDPSVTDLYLAFSSFSFSFSARK